MPAASKESSRAAGTAESVTQREVNPMSETDAITNYELAREDEAADGIIEWPNVACEFCGDAVDHSEAIWIDRLQEEVPFCSDVCAESASEDPDAYDKAGDR